MNRKNTYYYNTYRGRKFRVPRVKRGVQPFRIRRNVYNAINKIIEDNKVDNLTRQLIHDNKINKNYKKLNKNLNQIKKEIDKNKESVTNLQKMTKSNMVPKKTKELRVDKLYTPMEMVLRGEYMPLYKSLDRCLISYAYTKIEFALKTNYPTTRILVFPYSVNFATSFFDQIDDPVLASNAVCNSFDNVVWFRKNSDNSLCSVYKTTRFGVAGNWKLLGTTYKLTNVSPSIYQGGLVTVTKLVDNNISPTFMNSQVSWQNDHYVAQYEPYMFKDYSQVQPKNNFFPNKPIFIDEFNVFEGTNIYQSIVEYLGCKYKSVESPGAEGEFPNDPVGNNTKYLFEIECPATSNQTYILEIWNVIHVIPMPDSGLSNLTKIYKNFSNNTVIQKIKSQLPMYQK